MLEVKMPPEPEPEPPPPPPQLVITETEDGEEELAPVVSEAQEKEFVPDEDVFKEPPMVKKVKRKASAKQLAHLEKMRAKKEANRQAKEEWMEEQKSKQQKFVKQERKTETRATRVKQPKKNKNVSYQNDAEIEEYHPGYGGSQNEPINQESSEEEIYEEEHQGIGYGHRQNHQQVGGYTLTAEQVRALQFDAIADYEVIRKQAKLEKRQTQQQEYIADQTQKVFKQMRGRTHTDPNDPWGSCFQ